MPRVNLGKDPNELQRERLADTTAKIIKKAMRLPADGKTTELVNAVARSLTYPGQFCYVDYSPDRAYSYGQPS